MNESSKFAYTRSNRVPRTKGLRARNKMNSSSFAMNGMKGNQMKEQSQRYSTKFVNGSWVVFDTVNFENIRLFTLYKEANEVQKIMNRKALHSQQK